LDRDRKKELQQSKIDFIYVNMITQKKFDANTEIISKYCTTSALREILMRDFKQYGSFNKKMLLIDTIKRIFDYTDIAIPLIGHPYKNNIKLISENYSQEDIAYFDSKRDFEFVNNDYDTIKLSSGQKTFVRFLCYALAGIEQNSLIIYDEPENFLHPNLEILFLEIFEQILQSTDSIGLIATHSSVIVRELPSSSVNILIHDQDGYFVSKPNIETFGANLQSISNYVFGDFESTKMHQTFMSKLTQSAKSIDEIIQKYKELDASIVSQMILSSKLTK
jgi:predicted ATP-dependent endonuclease of OLD family